VTIVIALDMVFGRLISRKDDHFSLFRNHCGVFAESGAEAGLMQASHS
jgi:hypothetical protein